MVHGRESKAENRDDFARQLAGLADVFVNDAFGSGSRMFSTYYVTKYLPSFAGYLMQKEIQNLSQVLSARKALYRCRGWCKVQYQDRTAE